MSVYVDDMKAKFGRMIMCHMIADTHDELMSMAKLIGVNTKWIQHPNTPNEHFDIALSKRAIAVNNGAIEITWRQCAMMTKRQQIEGKLGLPQDAEEWYKNHLKERGVLK